MRHSFYIIILALLNYSCQNFTQKTTTNSLTSNDSTELKCCNQNIPERFSNTAVNSNSIIQTPNKHTKGMVLIPGGEFIMGGNDQWSKDDEYPRHKVKLDSFYMDETPVTNAQFAAFVKATGYITTAEQKPDWNQIKEQLPDGTPKPHDSVLQPASLVFTPPNEPVSLNNHLIWWSWVKGANWKKPQGPGSNIKDLENHPVVHVTYHDALTYAKWAGKRLPTEAEFEYAARGGLLNNIYPWGNERIHKGETKANYWTGDFPLNNNYADGFYYTSPVKQYAANGYGLFDMAGNVWEWTADWYHHNYYSSVANGVENPQGPAKSYDPAEPRVAKRSTRGGSYLCNDAYCSGFRVAARMKADPYSSQGHIGFRCVKDL